MLWLTIALGPKKSGSCAAASTASRTFHDDPDSVVVVVPLLRCDDAEVEEEVEGGNKEGVGVTAPLPRLDEEEDRRPANISSKPPISSSRDGGRGVTAVRRILEDELEVNDGGNTVVAVKAEAASDWV